MKTDIILAGVSGQGVLPLARLIAQAALDAGLQVKQTESCALSREGVSRDVHLRLSDRTIFSDVIPRGQADLLIGLEPVEALRHRPYLSATGWLVTAVEPQPDAIPNYPSADLVMAELRTQRQALLLPAAEIAKTAGTPKHAALVVLGAAATVIPLPEAVLLNAIRKQFDPDGVTTSDLPGKAFAAGRARPVPATRKLVAEESRK